MNEKIQNEQPLFPQEPIPPFPYHEEEVTYENKEAGITISGTLSLPKSQKPMPAVLLIAGYGPNDRDYILMGHKRFMVLADHLTRCGLAVLRFDKRGIGKSTGSYKTATSKDFAEDVLAGIEYLKTRTDIDTKHIGLIGHSEGGMIASMVAAQSHDIAFVVSMAGVVQTAVDDLVAQTAQQLRADGASPELLEQDKKIRPQMFNIIKQEPNSDIAKSKLQKLLEDYWQQLSNDLKIESDKIPFAISKAKADGFIDVFNSPWYRYFFSCQPAALLSNIQIPLLALYGDHDWIASSQPSLAIINDVLKKAGNEDYTAIELSGLNHVFQTCQTGSLAEYATIKETIAPVVLETISDWIVKKTNN